jgi:di/tricarboxylate transporter
VKITWKTIAPLVIWLAIYLVPVPAGLNVNQWQCAPKARITSGGRFHPESCRLIW